MDHPRFRIREAVIGDYEGLSDLFRELDTLHSEALPHVFRSVDRPLRSRDYVGGFLADDNSTILVAELDGRILGGVQVAVRDAANFFAFAARRYGWVESLGVVSDCRRRGVGRALMEAAEQWVRAKGATQCELNVWEFNENAIEFYHGLGYETASRRMWKKLP